MLPWSELLGPEQLKGPNLNAREAGKCRGLQEHSWNTPGLQSSLCLIQEVINFKKQWAVSSISTVERFTQGKNKFLEYENISDGMPLMFPEPSLFPNEKL